MDSSGITPTLSTVERQWLAVILRQVEADLVGNVLPFWLASLDRRFGGFVTELDRYAHWTRCTDKWVVAQSRMLWTYSAAHRHGIASPHYSQMAEQGARFLMDRMWDSRHGGFYWCLRRNGRVKFDQKYLCAQTFAIYALTEYYMATGDRDVLSLAETAFEMIETKAKDGDYGYLENLSREWIPISIAWGTSRIPTPYRKTLNVHIHVVEALALLLRATGKAEHRSVLAAVVNLILDKALHSQNGIAHETFSREWEPVPSADGQFRTSYGHNVETAWLLTDAMDALGESWERVRLLYMAQLDHALEYGFDWDRGGLASSGPIAGPATEADKQVKDWWVQAENLIATITAYRWLGDQRYLAAFEKQWEWILKHQIDHEGGDWYRETDWSTGIVHDTRKGKRGWKACYHNGRALMRVSTELRKLLGLQSDDAMK